MYFTTPAQLPGALAIDFSYGILCVPETRYFQSFDPTQLAQISEYYVAYQRNQSPSALCSICRSSHSTTRICLPPIFSNQALDAFLLVVNGNYPLTIFLHEILSFIQICGYFLLKPQFVFDLLQKNISPDIFTGMFPSVTFLNELQRQGFCETFTYFSPFHAPVCFIVRISSIYSCSALSLSTKCTTIEAHLWSRAFLKQVIIGWPQRIVVSLQSPLSPTFLLFGHVH